MILPKRVEPRGTCVVCEDKAFWGEKQRIVEGAAEDKGAAENKGAAEDKGITEDKEIADAYKKHSPETTL